MPSNTLEPIIFFLIIEKNWKMVENDYNLENGKFETKFLVIEKIGK